MFVAKQTVDCWNRHGSHPHVTPSCSRDGITQTGLLILVSQLMRLLSRCQKDVTFYLTAEEDRNFFGFLHVAWTLLLWLVCEETTCSCRRVWETIDSCLSGLYWMLCSCASKHLFPSDDFCSSLTLLKLLTHFWLVWQLLINVVFKPKVWLTYFFFRFPQTAVNRKCSDL